MTQHRGWSPWRRHLLTRFVLSLLLVAVLPLAGVGLGLITLTRNTLTAHEELLHITEAGYIGEEIAAFITGQQSALEVMAQYPFADLSPEQQKQAVYTFAREQSETFHHVYFINAAGEMVIPPNHEHEKEDQHSEHEVSTHGTVDTSQPEFSAVLAGQPYLSPVRYAEEHPYLVIAVPVWGAEGQTVQGMLAGEILLDTLWDHIAIRKACPYAGIYVLDQEGRLIEQSPGLEVPASDFWQSDFVQQAAASGRPGSGLFTYRAADPQSDEQIRWVGFYAPMPGDLGWTVLEVETEQHAFACIAAMQRRALLWIGGGVALALAVSLWLVRDLRRPIEALTGGARRISHGELGFHINVNRPDELGELADAFNTMSRNLARLEQAKADLTNMIVHDLKNPLGVILSALQLLQIKAEKQHSLPEDQAKLVDMALENGDRLLAMIHTLLDVTRLENGALVLHQEEVSLTSLITEATKDLASLAAAEGKEIIVQVPEDMPPVLADRDLIRRVLDNLLSNALKYTRRGGHIWVSGRPDPEGKWGIVAVRDDGEGIPAEHQALIFERFGQVDAGDARSGAGLGLTFCKLAVEAHGGRIWVESAPGEGSTFLFS
ncbi:MAG TPA: sensor histidine kinase, partial [Anaerolineae bacterium]|nr:sensor histidine kinase [Anaerolineae bacterium]